MILSSIKFSPESLSELDKGKISIIIQRIDIRDVWLKYGFAAERPITQTVIGVLLILAGFYLGVVPIYRMILHRDYPYWGSALELFAYAVPLVIIGGYFLRTLFVKRFYLLIHTETGQRKLIFHDKLRSDEVQAFIMNCNSALGYRGQIEENR